VSDSIPILYFGDLGAYQKSNRRIITVAVNPSFQEFPLGNPWLRFPNCSYLRTSPPTTAADFARYQAGLDNYFTTERYDWFDCLKPVLKGFDASFTSGATNRALHTDLMTPVATHPTWSDAKVRPHWPAFQSLGIPLWGDLVEELQPHIALVSFKRDYLAQIKLPGGSGWAAVAKCTKAWGADARTIEFQHQAVRLASGHLMDMVYVPQFFQQPFSGLDEKEKFDIGNSMSRTGTKGKLTHWK
jgi:hypothetical protein